MPLFSSDLLESWSGGSWTHLPETEITSVGHDTRTLKEGALYVALPGARVDGHDLISNAMEAGAAAVLCKQGKAVEGIACLEVKDPALALRQLANGHRSRCTGNMIGITGSAGKTTAKDFLSAMCRAAGSTCATPGNWNNFIGLPLSILRMETDDRFGIFELGMNHAGEIAALAGILEPTLACITSIGEAHLEQLGSVPAIAQEKTSLFGCLPEKGLAVIDLDSDWRDLMMSQSRCRQITCSLYEDADVVGHSIPDQPHLLRVEDRTRGEIWEIPVPLPGEHMRKNLLQTSILARECGVTPEEMAKGLEAYQGSPMRWEEWIFGDRLVINDAYNANPLSMRCALKAFSEQVGDRPAWVVLGGMAELGPRSHILHRELGETLSKFPLQGVITVGEEGAWIAEGIQGKEKMQLPDIESVANVIQNDLPETAAVFLKASRSVGLEKIVRDLQEKNLT